MEPFQQQIRRYALIHFYVVPNLQQKFHLNKKNYLLLKKKKERKLFLAQTMNNIFVDFNRNNFRDKEDHKN